MLTLFALLALQILPVVHWVKPGCHLFIRYMALLFEPISVGVMKNYTDVLSAQFGPIVTSILSSAPSWCSPLSAGAPISGIPVARRRVPVSDIWWSLPLPLYEQMHQIRARWKSLIGVCLIGSLTAMLSGTAIALWMGATPEIAATILPKSVTTPIVMAVSDSLHGIPAISAICVLIASVLGEGVRPYGA
nr:Cytidine deaminase [Candidatus Pantoea persica]